MDKAQKGFGTNAVTKIKKMREEESNFSVGPSAIQEETPEERETIVEETDNEGGVTASTSESKDLDDLQPSPETDNSCGVSSESKGSDDDSGDFGFDFQEAREIYSEWIQDMDRDDKMMLSVFLSDFLVNKLHFKVKYAFELVGSLVCKNEKTVRTWRRQFYRHLGTFPVSCQGMHNRYSVLDEEDVKEKALAWLRKGAYDNSSASKLTAHSFLAFVNNELLPSCDLPDNAPTQISLRCAYRWMHKMGFRYLRYKKGTFVDGNDREDVVEYRGMFLRKMNALESTHQPPPLPGDNLHHPFSIGNPSAQRKLVVIFHDESVFHANEDHVCSWTENGRMKLKPKGPGRGIMISDFVDEHEGFLRLSDEDLQGSNREIHHSSKVQGSSLLLGKAMKDTGRTIIFWIMLRMPSRLQLSSTHPLHTTSCLFLTRAAITVPLAKTH